MLALICTGEQHAVILLAIVDTYTRIHTWSRNHAGSLTIHRNRMLFMCQHHDFFVNLSQ